MSIRIGQIELTGVQHIQTSEISNLVEQKIPGRRGNFFQNMGQEPITIVIEGFMAGEKSSNQLETLREAHIKGAPLSFIGDIALGSELTDVLIEDFQVRQIAGYKNRYRYGLKIREYFEPPEPENKGIEAVNMSILNDAAQWAADTLTLAKALQEPLSLSGLLKFTSPFIK